MLFGCPGDLCIIWQYTWACDHCFTCTIHFLIRALWHVRAVWKPQYVKFPNKRCVALRDHISYVFIKLPSLYAVSVQDIIKIHGICVHVMRDPIIMAITCNWINLTSVWNLLWKIIKVKKVWEFKKSWKVFEKFSRKFEKKLHQFAKLKT